MCIKKARKSPTVSRNYAGVAVPPQNVTLSAKVILPRWKRLGLSWQFLMLALLRFRSAPPRRLLRLFVFLKSTVKFAGLLREDTTRFVPVYIYGVHDEFNVVFYTRSVWMRRLCLGFFSHGEGSDILNISGNIPCFLVCFIGSDS